MMHGTSPSMHVAMPKFDKQWRPEFEQARHPSLWVLRSMMLIFGGFTLLSTVVYVRREVNMKGSPIDSPLARVWVWRVWSGYATCAVASALMSIVCGLRRLRAFARQHYEIIAAVWLTVSPWHPRLIPSRLLEYCAPSNDCSARRHPQCAQQTARPIVLTDHVH